MEKESNEVRGNAASSLWQRWMMQTWKKCTSKEEVSAVEKASGEAPGKDEEGAETR